MAVEESPSFQWYVKEWRSSRAVMRMTFAQRGMYLEMLNEQWENLTLPDSPAEVAELIGGTVSEWTKAWPVLRRKFVKDADGRIYNLRLEKERDKQRSRSKRSSDKGKAGAQARWHKHRVGMAQASSSHDTPMPSDGFALSIASPIAFAIPTPDTPGIAEAPPSPPPSDPAQDVIASRAGQLLNNYAEWYPRYRHGARLRLLRNSLEFNDACALVETWDDARLEKLARIVLTTDDEFINRTDRSFKIFAMKATWADDRLRQWEQEHGIQATA